MKKQMHKLYADPDYLDRMRERSINQWKDPNGKSRKKLYTYLHKFKPSSLEMQFKQYLDDANILYKQQYKPKGCHRVYDFMLIDYNALIEIDGMFWHYSKWAINHGKPDNDAYKEKYAIEHGFDFVRIPECDLTQAIVTDWLLPELLKVGDNDS
jgi:very-short-patch-repair endonuclease